jgi:hypothetical protein
MTVIRKAIIDIETRQKKATLNAPDAAPAVRAYEAESKAAGAAAKSTQAATVATEQHSTSIRRHSQTAQLASVRTEQAITRSNASIVRSLTQAGSGAFQFARGLAFLSASGEEDMRKLVQTISLAQGAFDVFRGGAKTLSALSAAFGPLGIAAGAFTLTLGAGFLAWQKWKQGAEQAAKTAREELAKARKALVDFQEQQTKKFGKTADAGQRRIGLALSQDEQASLIRAELSRLQQVQSNAEADIGRTFRSGRETKESATTRAGAQQRLADAIERQIELFNELARIEQDRIAQQRQAAVSAARNFPGFLGDLAESGVNANAEAQNRALVANYSKMFDNLIALSNMHAKRAEQELQKVKREIEQGNPQ